MDKLFYDVLGVFGFAHPLHPVLITLVVGPVVASFAFGAIAIAFKKPEFFKTMRQLTVFAFVAWFPAVAVGLIDWFHFYGGSTKMVEINVKLVLAGVLFVVLLGNILLFRAVKNDSIVPVVLALLATVNVSALGFYGGEIVFGSKGAKGQETTAPSETTSTSDGYKSVVTGGYTVQWKFEGEKIKFRVSYKTDGWVGIGFGTTGTMEGSHIVIGYIGADGQAKVEDHFGNGPSMHEPQSEVGGKNSLSEVSGSFENATTTLAFTLPKRTGNPKDPVLNEGETYKVLLANGGAGAKDVTSYHGSEGRIVVDLKL